MEYDFALHFAASLIQFCDALCSNYPRDQKIKMERVKNRPVTEAQMKYNGIPEPVLRGKHRPKEWEKAVEVIHFISL